MLDEAGWLAICFVIFLIVFFRPFKKAILSFLDGRIKDITSEISAANSAKENAVKELEALKSNLQSMEAKHSEMIKASEVEMEKKFQERCEIFNKSLEYKKNAARDYINQKRHEAVADIEREVLTSALHLVSSYFQAQNSNSLDLAIVSANNLKQKK